MIHFIVNEHSRSGKGVRVWKQVEALLKKEEVTENQDQTPADPDTPSSDTPAPDTPAPDTADLLVSAVMLTAVMAVGTIAVSFGKKKNI